MSAVYEYSMSTVRVHTSVSVGPSDDEPTRGVEVVNGFIVQILLRDDGLNHGCHQVCGDLLLRDFLAVLGIEYECSIEYESSSLCWVEITISDG
jgi:hypothetical protein